MNVTDEIYHWDQIAPVKRWKRWINQLDPVYNLQSTDDNKESTAATYRCHNLWRWNRQQPTINRCSKIKQINCSRYHNLPRCSKMPKDDRKPATDQQMDQWINGSTDLWINGSTMKVNAPKTEMTKRKLLRILWKVPA